ncbi:MAG: hypothetical protein AAF669_07400 [Pseudomonadota bacterium]
MTENQKIKGYFKKGSTPTEEQFAELIDYAAKAEAQKISGQLKPETLPDTIATEKLHGKLTTDQLPDQIPANRLTGTLPTDQIPNASATQAGTIRFATTQEVAAGTADNVAITAKALKQEINRLRAEQALGLGIDIRL